MLRLMVVKRSRVMLVGVFVLASASCGSPAQEQAAPLAEWVLAQPPKPDDVTLQLVVQEQSCNGGRAPDGRIVTELENEDRILVTVRVEPLEEGGTGLPNPPTSHTVRLQEPVGERVVLDAALRPPAPAAPPFPGFAPAR